MVKNTCAVCNAKLMERGKIVKAFTTEKFHVTITQRLKDMGNFVLSVD